MTRNLEKDIATLLGLMVSQAVTRAKAGDPDIKEIVSILDRGRKELARRPAESLKQKALVGLLEEGVSALLDRASDVTETMRPRDPLAIWDLSERCLRLWTRGGDADLQEEEGIEITKIRQKIRGKLYRALDLDEEAAQ
jgi:hypothetical protein